MSNVLIPIDPDKKDDGFYRYKMPAVQVKIESSGNGVKTVIPNIHDICSALNRPEEVLMSFFQFELGAQCTINAKDDKYLLMGKHTEERMQELIYSFIKKFILCSSCQNPETAVNLHPERKAMMVDMTCGACGATSRMDENHRVYTIMERYYKRNPEKAKSGKGTAEGRKTDAATAAPAAQPAAEDAAAKSAARVVQVSDLADNRRDPNELATGYMQKAEAESAAVSGAGDAATKSIYLSGPAIERLTSEMVRLLSEYNLDESFAVRLLIFGIFSIHRDRPLAAIKAYAPLLRRFSTVAELFFRQETFDEKTLSALLKRESKIQRLLMLESALHLSKLGPVAAEKMPVLAFQLFIEGIVKDTSILLYATFKPIPGIDPSLDAAMKKNTMAVVEWLGVKDEKPAEAPVVEAAEGEKDGKKDRKKDRKKESGEKQAVAGAA